MSEVVEEGWTEKRGERTRREGSKGKRGGVYVMRMMMRAKEKARKREKEKGGKRERRETAV